MKLWSSVFCATWFIVGSSCSANVLADTLVGQKNDGVIIDKQHNMQAKAETTRFAPGSCEIGIYRLEERSFVTLTKGDRGFNYTFSDGLIGNTQDANALVECGRETVRVFGKQVWHQQKIRESNVQFESHGVTLAGRLLEAPDAGKTTPLVVFAHGSEDSGWIDRAADPYQMVGRGVSAFVFDKRGTGKSKGEYTQNFPLLADDLVAAANEAKRQAKGRFGRFGLLGLSQGGWIAPLASERAQAEFLGIGFGLAVDIAEQDAAKVQKELKDRGYGADVLAQAQMITDVTAKLVKTAYKEGLDELADIQKRFVKEPWFAAIKGGYSGVYLNISVEDLRKNGLPMFDRLGVDWSQNPMHVLENVKAPQFWAFAEDDRQAPIAISLERLRKLRTQGHDITIHIFPNADHGILNYIQAADLSRKSTRIAAGYYDLMADWAKGQINVKYGDAYRH
ncbi:alpha/beta hydrolase family protein [Undibacterium sp. Di24W]|uniref:alpha/beta hydrolase family protein n=1 Tax=Undibacterium sp. Di24W TaxID=3413033 RepID=UPI003BF0172D